MKKIIISLFILSLNLSFAFSQQADSVLNKAVMLIDKGELVEAEKEIKKSIAEGIDTLPLHYEAASR